MLKLLVKKQLAEIFRAYFYDQKKNRMRSKGSVAAMFALFIFLMVGMVGGLFAMMAYSMCPGLVAADAGWLYYAIMGGLSVFLGVFGSVFNTYAGLYLAKDNDLLLSMPIPAKYIIISRLLTVYLMGLMYSAAVSVPAVIVYWIFGAFSVAAVVGGLLLPLLISVFVLSLSAALGWVVAKVSLKLKNKSFITVLLSLLFIAVYYFFYFKASEWIRILVANAAEYSRRIKGAAYGLYLFGCAGEGKWLPLLGLTAAVALLFFAVWRLLCGSFLKTAAADPSAAAAKAVRERGQRSLSRTLLAREFNRLTASPNYMLNCALGTVLLPAGGIALLLRGRQLLGMLDAVFGDFPGAGAVLLTAVVCLLATMNDTAAPGISLEGKTLWILHSLPVTPRQALLAKLEMQVLLTAVPMLLPLAAAAAVLRGGAAETVLMFVTALSFSLFAAVCDLLLGLRMPNLTWTSEVTPIKQNMNVFFALLIGWAYPLLLAGGWLLLGGIVGATVWLGAFSVLTLALAALLYRRLMRRGAAEFAALH